VRDHHNPFKDEEEVRLRHQPSPAKSGLVIPYALVAMIVSGGGAYHFFDVGPAQQEHSRRIAAVEATAVDHERRINQYAEDVASLKASIAAEQQTLSLIEAQVQNIQDKLYDERVLSEPRTPGHGP
jgi:septal ring factor EnvC (AmiA/AmiB activator)